MNKDEAKAYLRLARNEHEFLIRNLEEHAKFVTFLENIVSSEASDK